MTGTLHGHQYKFLILSRSVFLRVRIISHKHFRNMKPHILCSVIFFLKIVLLMR